MSMSRATQANARKEELFEEAKHLGALGDRSADQRLKAMEASMKNVDISSLKGESGTTTTTSSSHSHSKTTTTGSTGTGSTQNRSMVREE